MISPLIAGENLEGMRALSRENGFSLNDLLLFLGAEAFRVEG